MNIIYTFLDNFFGEKFGILVLSIKPMIFLDCSYSCDVT